MVQLLPPEQFSGSLKSTLFLTSTVGMQGVAPAVYVQYSVRFAPLAEVAPGSDTVRLIVTLLVTHVKLLLLLSVVTVSFMSSLKVMFAIAVLFAVSLA